MKELDVTVSMLTKHVNAIIDVEHYLNPGIRVCKALSFNAILGMAIGEQEYVYKDSLMNLVDQDAIADDSCHESINLEVTKAKRLVDLYQRLEPKHAYQCHDVVKIVEEWDACSAQQMVVQPEENCTVFEPTVISGIPYTVQIIKEYSQPLKTVRTHSCYGTDDNRLLGILGAGQMMATMTAEDTRHLYSNGAQHSFIARTDPSYIRE